MSVSRALVLRVLLGILTLGFFAQAWALPDNIVRIHYHRTNHDYDGWGLHVWGDNLQLDRKITWGRPLASTGVDGFGIYFDIPVTESTQSIGFIVHKGAEKNVPEDMNIQVSSTREVWHLEQDPNLYYSRASAAAALAPTPKPSLARNVADKENARKEAKLKAEMQILAKQAEIDAKKLDVEGKKQEEEAKLKLKEEQERLAAERDRMIAKLKAQRDANLAKGEKDRYRQQQEDMKAEMARRAAEYETKQERTRHGERMSPGTLFGIAVGGGFVALVIIFSAVVWWQRRKPSYPKVMI